MQNIDIKKIIIIVGLPLILIIGYLVVSYLSNENKKTSLEELGVFFPSSSKEEGGAKESQSLLNQFNLSENQLTDETTPILRQISNNPVAGATIFKKEINKKTEEGVEVDYVIRYIEKATGHIYEATANTFTQHRISNTTIPKIQEALWLDSNSLVIRYLDGNDIKTFSAKLVGEDPTAQELEGEFLQDNIKEIIGFKKGIFYLLENGSGSIGVSSDKQDENKKIIFESSLKEWLIENVNDKQISFTTKPAVNIPGFSFLFDTSTNSFNKIIGEKANLSTLTSHLTNILYSEYGKLGPKLSIYNNQEKTNLEVPLTTFPEKCVWNKDNTYLYCGVPSEDLTNSDLTKWYQGLISFSDNIWKIDTQNNSIEFLISPMEFEVENLDIVSPLLSEDENYLLFINKIDYSLWGLKLEKNLSIPAITEQSQNQ